MAEVVGGEYVAWVWDADATGSYGHYGLIWRDLRTGHEISEPGTYPYGLDMSADGRFVAYSQAVKVAKNGYVETMDVVLLDTLTGAHSIINRQRPGETADDGKTDQLSVSADGNYVVFPSTAPELIPSGEKVCTPRVTAGACDENSGYVYLYDRVNRTLTPVPPQPDFGGSPDLTDPVVSGDGSVVAFHDGLDVDVWYPRTGTVRRLDSADFPCGSDAESLAISPDGRTLASNCAGSVGVVALGGPTGTDSVEWTYTFPSSQGYENSVALSANGSVMALFGSAGPTNWGQWPVWVVQLPAGTMQLLPAPGATPGLKADPKLEGGMAGDG